MSFFLYSLGRMAARRRFYVLAIWVLVLALAGGAAATFSKGARDNFAIPGSESHESLMHLGHVFPEVSGTSAQLVVVMPDGRRVDTASTRAAVGSAVKRITAVEQVATVLDPFDKRVKAAISGDHSSALIVVLLKDGLADVQPKTRTELSAIAVDLERRIGQGATVHVGGDAFGHSVPGLTATEGLGVIVALVVLVLVFGSLLAAGIPLLTAMLGVGISVALIYAATVAFTISTTAPMLAVMLGLAVGIDYALFILSRHRDQLAEGLDVRESIARATATAGSAVVFAGLTVVIALLGLSVANIPFLTTMGIAAAIAVAMAVLVAVTFVPALLAVAGERLRPRSRKRRRGHEGAAARREPGRFSRRWVRLATKAPLVTVLIIVTGLTIVALPAAGLRLSLPDNGTEEHGTPARVTYDVIAKRFGPGYNGPLIVTFDVIDSHDPIGLVNGIADEIRRLDGVAVVPLATPNPKGDTGIIQVIPATGPDSARTDELVQRIRSMADHFHDRYKTDIAVTGITAAGIDVSQRLGRALVPFGVLVVGLSVVLLAMVFRSIWVPIKATAGYLLSVGAAFGATSFVFQQGHFADALRVSHTGSVISFLPIILMGVLFGLAMDYEVFLVTRIREDYVHNGDAHRAIETGFVSASRVVIAAAVIMFAVFAAFVPEGSAAIKPVAFSLAVGVFVDAFLVRMTLVPAVLALLGRRAWAFPVRLERTLPVFDTEGDALTRELRLADWPAPGCTEIISARDLRVGDDRDHTVFAGVTIHLEPGEILAVHGSGPVGKSALLCTLAGRVNRLDGDLKVLGRAMPQHARYVRRRVAFIPCRTTADPVAAVREALADGVTLILLDDLDSVVNLSRREALRELLASGATGDGCRATFVFTCQDPELLTDMLPPSSVRPLRLPVTDGGADAGAGAGAGETDAADAAGEPGAAGSDGTENAGPFIPVQPSKPARPAQPSARTAKPLEVP